MHGSKACGTGRKARRGVFKAREPKPATETRQIALLWRVTNKCEITFPVTALTKSWDGIIADDFWISLVGLLINVPTLRS